MASRNYRRSLAVWRSDFGREPGWIAERDGASIATLTEPRQDDMFWVQYLVTPTTADPSLAVALGTRAFWTSEESLKIRYRSMALGEYVDEALPAGCGPTVEAGVVRISMRFLYVNHRGPNLLDRVVLWAGEWLDRQRRKADTVRQVEAR